MIGVSVQSTNRFQSRLQQARDRYSRILLRGILDATEILKEESLRLVPKDTLYLSQTARITPVFRDKSTGIIAEAILGYGGKDFPPKMLYSVKENRMVERYPYKYAVMVHNIPGLGHNPPEQEDFLAVPVQTSQPEMIEAIRAAIARNRRGSRGR